MKKRIFAVMATVIAATLIAGCGSNKYSYEGTAAMPNSPSEYKMESAAGFASEAMAEEAVVSDYDNGGYANADILDGVGISQKLIKTVNLSLETTDFDQMIFNIEKETEKAGGYIETSNQYGTEKNHSRNSYLKVRVPSDKIDSFEDSIKGDATVTSRSSSVEDVTLIYSDIEAHIESLRIEQETLNTLLAKAENIEDIIVLTNKLTDVRYEIESYESQMKALKSQISYSTIYIDIVEVEETTVQPKDSFGVKLQRAFSDGMKGFGNGMASLVLYIVSNLIWFIITVAFVVVVVLIIVKQVKKNKAKKAAGGMNVRKIQEPPKKEDNK